MEKKELKAQNRLKAFELANGIYDCITSSRKEHIQFLKKRAEELLDWAYEEEEKEVNPAEWSSCEDLIERMEKAYIERQEKILENQRKVLLAYRINEFMDSIWK